MYVNEVTLVGRLTRDVELRALPSGISVGKFSVATNRTWKDKTSGEKKEEVEFHNIVTFGKTAETISHYFHKGDEIYVRGRLKTSSWEADGQKKYRTEIMLENFQFGQKRKDSTGGAVDQYRNDAVAKHADDEGWDTPNPSPDDMGGINPDDIPF
jgi:single-strand DNA-binding protein